MKIKKINVKLAPYIRHLIVYIIRNGIYPKTFKISKITPTLKPDKNKFIIDSNRPINNLTVIDKII